jgi:hypothetical protein
MVGRRRASQSEALSRDDVAASPWRLIRNPIRRLHQRLVRSFRVPEAGDAMVQYRLIQCSHPDWEIAMQQEEPKMRPKASMLQPYCGSSALWLPVGSQTGIPDLALWTITTARGEDVHS